MGPREWDLAPTAVYFDRFGWHTEAEYRAFTNIYGHDVMAWEGYEVLRDTRELLMVTWLAQNATPHNAAGIELAKRLHALRTGACRRNWVPF